MNTLGIESKEDSPEKLANAEGKPTKRYLFASEFNRLTSVVQLLMYLTASNQSSIDNILENKTVIDLGTITGSFIAEINSRINTEIGEGNFVGYKIGEVQYYQLFTGPTGTYGATSIGVTADLFVLIYQSDLVELATQVIKNFILQGGDFDRDLELTEMGITRFDYPVNGSKSLAIVFGNEDSIEFNLMEGISANIQVPTTGMGKKTLRYLEKPIKNIGTDYVIIKQDKESVLVLNNEDFVFYLNRNVFASGDELEIINYNAVNDPALGLVNPGDVVANPLKVWYDGTEYTEGGDIPIPLGKRALLKCIGTNKFALSIY